MHIENYYFDVSNPYRIKVPQTKTMLSEDLRKWTKPTLNDFAIGLGHHTLNEQYAIDELSKRFRELADNISKFDVKDWEESGPLSKHSPVNDYQSPRKDQNARIINSLLLIIIKTATQVDNEFGILNSLFTRIVTERFEQILNFANMWEFDLELPIDKNFIKQVLVFIADVICLQDGLKHDTISQFDLTTPTLENMNLYFSYGSNMSIDQMKKRCPSASPVCLAELLNFQYFINKRGVASVVPRIGHSTKGVIWDLKSNKNFVGM